MNENRENQPSDRVIEAGRALLSATKGDISIFGSAARELFRWITQNEIDSTETELKLVHEAFEDDDNLHDCHWIEVFRILEKKKLGKLILGRHGNKTRIAWQGGSSLQLALSLLKLPPRSSQAEPNGRFSPTTLRVGGIEIRFHKPASSDEFRQLIDILEDMRVRLSRNRS